MARLATAGTLFLFDFHYFAPLVLPAMRARPVGQLLLVAVRALGEAGRLQFVMRAAIAPAGGGMSSFRVRHFSILRILIFRDFATPHGRGAVPSSL
jgi:hypothetical protein